MSAAHRGSTAMLFAILVCLVGTAVSEAGPPEAYGRLPLSFEANRGQTHSSVDFVARSTGYQLFLTPGEAVIVLRRPGAVAADALRMTLLGANPERSVGVDQLPGAVSYLIGSDPAKWRPSIPTYAKVLARDIYPGVDLVYYGNQRQLEYDFIVAPGADPASIRLAFHGLASGATRPSFALDGNGDLTLRMPDGDVRLKRPVAYQEDADGQRHPVSAAFAIAPDAAEAWHVGFRVGPYDRNRPLVIDPVLSYSTYLGGLDADGGMAIAVRNGEAYVTGYTDSLNFPPAGGALPNQPGQDAFVAKLNASGSGLAYATYLGGNGEDAGMGIAVDSAGQAYVTGYTDSTDFPTVPAASPLFGNQGGRDAFVTQLNATGTGFVYSTYLGGGSDDTGLGIAVDAAGSAYVTGWTDSSDFPTTSSAFQGEQGGRDAFVTKLNPAGTALVYSTYLGGDGTDEGHAIALDASGNAHVTGDTTSTNLLTTANTRLAGGGQDAFVAKLDPGASGAASRLYLTYFGGSGADAGRGITVDSTGFIYVTGVTASSNLVTKFPYQAIHGGGQDAFLAKFNPAGAGPNQALMYSSFLGGSGDDAAHGIALDGEDQVSIAGSTTSGNFPTFHAMDTVLGGAKDAFVAKFDPADPGLPSLRYSTYLGGSGEDEGYGIAVDAEGSAYVVGLTRSGDFPGAVGSLSGTEDAFVAKLSEPDLVVSVLTVPATGGEGGVIAVTDTTRNAGVAAAGASTTSFYLSTDNKLDASDPFLGSRAVPALDPGEEDTIATQLTLPSPLAPATYYLFAKADAADAVGESFESNNKTKKTMVIGADLTVSALSATSSGLTITVTDTTKNVGGASVATSTTTKFFLVGPGGGVLLGSRTVAALGAGAESAASTDLSIPAGTAEGAYTLAARADADEVATETSETNNEKSTPFAVGVDLVVSAFSVPGTSGAGASISVTPTILNQGAIASATSTTEFFLSTTTSIDATAVSIGTQPAPALAPGATSAVAISLTIPGNTAAGSYFVIAKANAGASPLAETRTTNNTRARGTAVGPDMTISSVFPLSITAGPGGTITFKDTTRNLGGGTAAASVTKFYLSTDSVYDAADTELGQRSIPFLAPGAQDVNSVGVALTVPAGTTTGNYFIIARANAGASPITETNATNNTFTATLAVSGADLVVSALTVTLGGGSTLTITDTTKNQGTGFAGASTTRFYLSTDGTLDEATDALLGERAVGTLEAGAASDATSTFPLPAGTPAGTFTVFAKADADNAVTEGDETNNRRARTINTQGSDLVISNLLFSWGTGATLNVTDTTRNEGPGTAGASTTRFYLSTDATFGPGDTSLGSRSVVTLAAGSQSTKTTAVTIPATTAPGDYFLIARADDGDGAGEVNEENNATAKPITIKPDLTVSDLNLPATAGAGATITASGTVHNGGPIPAGASVLKLFLSTDATLDPGDTLVGSRAFGALVANRTDDFSIQVTLPDTLSGKVYIIAKIDADDQVAESNETNNTRSKSLDVGPDLIITVFSGPPTGGAGSTFTVSDTTRNQASVAGGASTTGFYLSTDAVFDPAADVRIGSRALPALGAKKTHAGNTSVTIPPATPSGNYFLIAVADADQQLNEGVETNNTASSAIIIGSDLVVSAVTAPASAGGGSTITVTDTTTNQGGFEAGPSTTSFYLSTNTTYEPTDTLLGSRAVGTLAVGAASSGSTGVVIPAGTPAGTYFVIARADALGAVSEVNEGNNTMASGAIVLGTDLVVSALSVPLTTGAGSTITISGTVANVGGTQAGESVLKFFLSSDGVVGPGDTLLGSRIVPALPAGGTSSGATQVTIPVDASTGVFFVIAQADADGQVPEVNETNNTFAASLTIGPDLQVTVLTAPTEGAPGAIVTIRDTTKNLGAAAGASVTRFYLSADAVLDVSVDTLLGSRNVPALAFGASSIGNTDVTLPTGLSSGTYFIIVKADATNLLVEALEDNNLRTRQINVGPDFIISAVTGPTEGGAGLPITVGASTKNQGAAGGPSVTQFYLSSDANWSGGDTLLGSRAVPALGAGSTNTGSISVTLPANLTAGPYFIIAKANGDGAASETDTSNNTKARSIIIGPDLVVSALTVPTSVGAGVSFTVTDTTRNTGAGATTASTTSYFLSTDINLDSPDVPIGSRAIPALAPGASNSGTATLTIPDGTPAGTYVIIARANETNAVSEIDTSNNERFKQTKVGPDLIISTFAAPTSATAGTTIIVTDTTTNQGAGNAGPFTVRVYLSADGTFDPGVDPEVGSRVVGGVAAGASNSGPINVAIPNGISGSFTLIAVADADNVVSELLNTNNSKQRLLNVLP